MTHPRHIHNTTFNIICVDHTAPFCFWFFSWISFPPAPEYPIRTVTNFFENLQRYSQVKVHHRYQWHRWQNCRWYQRHRRQILPPVLLVLLPPVSTTPVSNCHRYHWHRRQFCFRCQRHGWQIMETISDCRHFQVNLKAKIYIYMLILLPKGVQRKLFKFFWLKIFSICHCHQCQWHQWCTLSCEYLRKFSKKFETALIVYSGAWGKLIHEKTISRKSRGTVPLNSKLINQ